MKDFTGKVAFITGGASGAGLGQAKVFSEAGCKVVIADIRQDHLDEAVAWFKGRNADVHAIKLDITDREAYAAAADEVEEVYGSPPQLLFNTAGVNTFGPVEASTFEDFDWVLGVNLGGVINGLVTFVPRMIKAGKGGHIVTVSSWGGFMGFANTAAYAAAKAAVVNLMDSYYQALKPYGIGVSCLCPVGINSNIHEAPLTRPDHLKNTGYNVNEDTMAFEKRAFYENGIDPVDLAKILKKGIEDEQLYIFQFDDPETMLRNNFERMLNLSSPEGMKRQAELEQKQREAMARGSGGPSPMNGAEEAGWGKARKDIDWVKR
ncbi:MAG: SDR family NAD(P)-dependent oxidoreductase [Dehalococcoidales bacterium]|nr:SDR family NAD(P)-dependent oxidoreductase [Dehalococcoidales bacterium]